MSGSLYVLGIGGSGAKCGEALVHLLAAGLVDGDVELHFLDQDVTNGNLVKTRRLTELYKTLRKGLRPKLEAAGNHWLFKADLNAKNDVNTKGETHIWPPVHPPFEKLSQLFERNLLREEARHFFDSVFDRDNEIDLELVHGFRGRPAIGQAVLAAGLQTGLPFWKDLDDRINHGLHNTLTPQKYFLFGSVFGGTGAAGVPTVARHLQRRLMVAGAKKGLVCAALMLPYFSYPKDDPQGEQKKGRLLSSDTVTARARMALEYYRMEMDPKTRGDIDPKRALGRDRPLPLDFLPPQFDALYMVGWPETIDLKYVSAGGGDQHNPALLPELVAALSAVHFAQPRFAPSNHVYRAGYVGDAIDWEDLPSPHKDYETTRAIHHLPTLIRFAFAYKYVYYEALFGLESQIYRRQVWFENLIGDQETITPEIVELGRNLYEYCDLILRWCASMALHGSHPGCHLFGMEEEQFAACIEQKDKFGHPKAERVMLYEEMSGREVLMA